MKEIKALEKAFKDFSANCGCGCCGDFDGKVKARVDFNKALKELKLNFKNLTKGKNL